MRYRGQVGIQVMGLLSVECAVCPAVGVNADILVGPVRQASMRPAVAIVPAQCIVDITGKRVIGIQPELGPYRGDFRKVNDEFRACTIYVIPVSW